MFVVCLLYFFGRISVVTSARCSWLVQGCTIAWAHGFVPSVGGRGAGFRGIHITFLLMSACATVSTSLRAELWLTVYRPHPGFGVLGSGIAPGTLTVFCIPWCQLRGLVMVRC